MAENVRILNWEGMLRFYDLQTVLSEVRKGNGAIKQRQKRRRKWATGIRERKEGANGERRNEEMKEKGRNFVLITNKTLKFKELNNSVQSTVEVEAKSIT